LSFQTIKSVYLTEMFAESLITTRITSDLFTLCKLVVIDLPIIEESWINEQMVKRLTWIGSFVD